ncbi:NTP transferase domain-containing protein [Armatimonas sp.]|uniref:NTP transferase domain-containing protein n=1 Tax=Armatimonas sp. TaxID=1872638 RepID=UPI00374D87F3
MQVVIPLSGQGSRFQRAGYSQLKPLIEVEGMPMIEHVVRMFPGETDFLFICGTDALETIPELRPTLQRLAPEGKIVGIAPHKRGPVWAALQASEWIKDDQPIVLNYTDFSVGWDFADFKATMERENPAGCVTAYRGFHPHSLGPNLYAYLRHDEASMAMLEIQEKHCFTDNRLEEFASSGTYYFRSGALLKATFQEAVERNLSTNGEFYASVPFNLLVEKNEPVRIYELEHFLQWGTPEDLEEYLAWSRYFSHYAEKDGWAPELAVMPGTNLIPMAGAGMRFAQEGYKVAKPLVPVDGTPMIARALRSLPAARNWIAACRTEHLASSCLAEYMSQDGRHLTLLPVEELTEGQACTCLLARGQIDPEAPLLIAPCDAAFVYDALHYDMLTQSESGPDCLIWTFRNHPHANRHPKQYGWVELDAKNNAQTVLCKQAPEGDIRQAHGVIGAFWFKKAKYFFKAADALIAQNLRVNGEFYVDSSINLLLEQGRTAQVFPVEHYLCFGVPDDVRIYNYWATYFAQRARA